MHAMLTIPVNIISSYGFNNFIISGKNSEYSQGNKLLIFQLINH